MRDAEKLDLIRYHLAQCDPEGVPTVHLKKALEIILEILSKDKASVVTHQHYYPDNFSEFG